MSVHLWYFKLWILFDQIVKVWNIEIWNQVAKIFKIFEFVQHRIPFTLDWILTFFQSYIMFCSAMGRTNFLSQISGLILVDSDKFQVKLLYKTFFYQQKPSFGHIQVRLHGNSGWIGSVDFRDRVNIFSTSWGLNSNTP